MEKCVISELLGSQRAASGCTRWGPAARRFLLVAPGGTGWQARARPQRGQWATLAFEVGVGALPSEESVRTTEQGALTSRPFHAQKFAERPCQPRTGFGRGGDLRECVRLDWRARVSNADCARALWGENSAVTRPTFSLEGDGR